MNSNGIIDISIRVKDIEREISSDTFISALKPKIKSHYRGHKMAVWLNLIPQLHQPGDEDVSMRHHHFRERGDDFYAGIKLCLFVCSQRLFPLVRSSVSRGSFLSLLRFVFAGPVRDEWHTPLPLVGSTKTTSSSSTTCTTSMTDVTTTENIGSILDDNEDDAELLQRLESRHYYSTTTALAITVGIGCILLILNMLIFAGIYYQRDRMQKKRAAMQCTSNGQESLPMTTRQSMKQPDVQGPAQEPPPSYTTLARSPSIIQDEQLALQTRNQQCMNNGDNDNEPGSRNSYGNSTHPTPPRPPTRTTSSLSTTTASGAGTIKKRVQIQEISV